MGDGQATTLAEIYGLLADNQNKITSGINSIKNDVTIKLDETLTRIRELVTNIKSLKLKVENLQRREIMNNIQIIGLPNRKATLLDSVMDLLNNNMNLHVIKEDINRCYEVTYKGCNKAIIVEFTSHLKRSEVLNSHHKFTDCGIYITEDVLVRDTDNENRMQDDLRDRIIGPLPASRFAFLRDTQGHFPVSRRSIPSEVPIEITSQQNIPVSSNEEVHIEKGNNTLAMNADTSQTMEKKLTLIKLHSVMCLP